jgi:hypothetical protein
VQHADYGFAVRRERIPETNFHEISRAQQLGNNALG